MIIFFVVDFFEDLEIVICFEGYMFRIFFVVLKDVNGRYLVENFRICLIFFMIIFKFIYDCLVDFYSQIGVLIVGDLKVGCVKFDGRVI